MSRSYEEVLSLHTRTTMLAFSRKAFYTHQKTQRAYVLYTLIKFVDMCQGFCVFKVCGVSDWSDFENLGSQAFARTPGSSDVNDVEVCCWS